MRKFAFQIKSRIPLGLKMAAAMICVALLSNAPAPAEVGRYNPERKNDRTEIYKLLREQNTLTLRQADLFDAYFNEYIFPIFLNPKAVNKLPEYRDQLRRYFQIGKSGEPYERLNKLTREFVQHVLKTSKDTTLRYNAVLILGELNEFEAMGVKKMKPWPTALPDLIKLLGDEKQPDYTRVAALMGVLRHASLSDDYPLPAEAKNQLVTVGLKLLQQVEVPASRSPAGHAYVRRTAAELLGYVGEVGEDGEVVNEVLKVASDPQEPLVMRVAILPVLGMFRYGANPKVDFASMLAAVGNTVVEASEYEIARAEALSEERQEEIDPDRRRLSYIFRQAYWALQGPTSRPGGMAAAASQSPASSSIQSFRTKISKALTLLDKVEFVDPIEFSEVLAGLQADLPARAKAARVPADADSE